MHGRHPHTIGDAYFAWFGRNPSGGRIVATFTNHGVNGYTRQSTGLWMIGGDVTGDVNVNEDRNNVHNSRTTTRVVIYSMVVEERNGGDLFGGGGGEQWRLMRYITIKRWTTMTTYDGSSSSNSSIHSNSSSNSNSNSSSSSSSISSNSTEVE